MMTSSILARIIDFWSYDVITITITTWLMTSSVLVRSIDFFILWRHHYHHNNLTYDVINFCWAVVDNWYSWAFLTIMNGMGTVVTRALPDSSGEVKSSSTLFYGLQIWRIFSPDYWVWCLGLYSPLYLCGSCTRSLLDLRRQIPLYSRLAAIHP